MIDEEEIIRRLILHEGMRLEPYKCSKGYLTIGVGRNLITNPLSKEEKEYIGDWSKGITREEALYLLRHDIKRLIKECKEKISCWRYLDAERKYALLDMAFNLGISGVLKFKNMLEALSIGDYRGAAKECLNSKYAKDVGIRAVRIANIFKTGRFEI